MLSEIVNAGNFSSIALDDNDHFKFCTFEDISTEGGLIESDFNTCTFRNIDWYWGLFSSCNFIQCEFAGCVFRGTSFADCRFIECTFKNCQFLKDNLDTDCTMESSLAYACSIENSPGFMPQLHP